MEATIRDLMGERRGQDALHEIISDLTGVARAEMGMFNTGADYIRPGWRATKGPWEASPHWRGGRKYVPESHHHIL